MIGLGSDNKFHKKCNLRYVATYWYRNHLDYPYHKPAPVLHSYASGQLNQRKLTKELFGIKKLLKARSPNWFGGRLRSLAVAKPATPMERFDDKKHLLGKTTSFFLP